MIDTSFATRSGQRNVSAGRGIAVARYDAESFEGLRRAGRLVADCLDAIAPLVRPDVPTARIEEAVLDFILAHGALPATLHYRGYRHSTCISINHVVCHGMPGPKPFRDGDIVNIDVSLILDGWHGDTSRMYAVGEPKRAARRLMEVTHEAMWRGVRAVRPGATLGDIGHAIQAHAEGERCSVVRDFCGHGIGRAFHEPPNILHYGRRGEGPALDEGMVFTIEPMINLGRPGVKILSDGWTAVTRDRSLSAQYEHMVGVTATGVEVFTLSAAERADPAFAHSG